MPDNQLDSSEKVIPTVESIKNASDTSSDTLPTIEDNVQQHEKQLLDNVTELGEKALEHPSKMNIAQQKSQTDFAASIGTQISDLREDVHISLVSIEKSLLNPSMSLDAPMSIEISDRFEQTVSGWLVNFQPFGWDWWIELVVQILAIVAATFAIIWQVRKQFSLAIDQTKSQSLNQISIELNKDVRDSVKFSYKYYAKIRIFLQLLPDQCIEFNRMRETHGSLIPNHRTYTEYSEMAYQFRSASNELIALTETIESIDPRVKVFRWAFNETVHRFQEAERHVSVFLAMKLSSERPTENGPIIQPPRSIPTNPQIEEHRQFFDVMVRAIDDFGSYSGDFRTEMQNLLLADIQNLPLPVREPVDPSYKVISLEKSEKLEKYFFNETSWGRRKRELEAAIRDAADQQ